MPSKEVAWVIPADPQGEEREEKQAQLKKMREE